MLEAIRRASSFLRQKQILHKLGVVVSVTVIGIACYVLYHMLRGIDVNEVIEAIKATEPRQIVLAALFVAAGYFTLTFYDLFAVRAIGRNDVPYRVNALAAFTSYSIGHNVGASVFTGGAVRYRIYSAWGLNAIDVAKICFLAGLTFWLGNAAVLGIGIAYHPEAAAAIDQLPPWLNRAGRVRDHRRPGGLCGLGLDPAARGRPRAVDRDAAGRPADAAADRYRHCRSRLLRARDVRAGAGRAQSRLRRGRGDFRLGDAARLRQPFARAGSGCSTPPCWSALWQMDREDLLAGMLLFRVLYYIAPFVISVILLTLREVILGARMKRLRHWRRRRGRAATRRRREAAPM